jgi:hypothetical protein
MMDEFKLMDQVKVIPPSAALCATLTNSYPYVCASPCNYRIASIYKP